MAEKLPSGKYRAKAFYTDENGKRRSVSFTSKSKREADYMAAEYAHTHQSMSQTALLTVHDAIEKLISSSDAVLSPSTIRGYNTIKRNYIAEIQDTRLCDLSSSVLQAWINGLSRKYSPKTVKNAYGLITSVLSTYFPQGTYSVNLPQQKAKEVIIPQKEDIELLLKSSEGTNLYPVILLGAHMGMRRSEIAALTWNDIDLKNRKIKVNKAIVPGDYGFELKQPKTLAGTRILDMTNLVYQYFSSQDQSLPPITLNPESMSTAFRRLCAKLNVPFHLHLLRHYFASVCASKNLPESYAAMLMGHSSYDMIKKVYGHILNEEEKKARNLVLDYFNQ